MAIGLVLEHEFRRVEQGPEQILDRGSAIDHRAAKKFVGHCEFLIGWEPAIGQQIDLLNQPARTHWAIGQRGDTPFFGRQLFLNAR